MALAVQVGLSTSKGSDSTPGYVEIIWEED